MIERAEPAIGPIGEDVLLVRRIERRILVDTRARASDAYFLTGEPPVAVPVVDFERPLAAAPFRLADDAVAVPVHFLETHSRRAALCAGLAGCRHDHEQSEHETLAGH